MPRTPVKQERLTSLVGGVLIALALAVCGPAFSAQEREEDTQEPVVFSLASIAPWATETPDGEPQGLLVEIVKELRARTGLPLRYQVRPHARTLLELEEGIADFAPSFASPRADEIGERIGHLVTARVLVLGRSDDETVESLAELDGQNVGYVSGTWYGPTFEKNEKIHKVPVNDVAHGVRLLKRDRLKAMVATEIAIPAGYNPESDDTPDLKVLMELEPNEGKLYMSRESSREQAKERITEALREMHEDGTMDQLFKARFGTSPNEGNSS